MVEAILKRDTLPDEERDLLAIANNLNLDVDAFALALRDHRHLQAIESDAEAGRSRSLVGPALFFNGERFDGSLTVPQLAAFMDENTCCGKTLPLARPTALSPVP